MSERSTAKLEPIIKFGFDDSSLMRVENVLVTFNDGTEWNFRKGQDGTNYDRISIQKSCNELYCMFYVNNNKLKDDIFIPIHSISRIQVKHFVEEKKNET